MEHKLKVSTTRRIEIDLEPASDYFSTTFYAYASVTKSAYLNDKLVLQQNARTFIEDSIDKAFNDAIKKVDELVKGSLETLTEIVEYATEHNLTIKINPRDC